MCSGLEIQHWFAKPCQLREKYNFNKQTKKKGHQTLTYSKDIQMNWIPVNYHYFNWILWLNLSRTIRVLWGKRSNWDLTAWLKEQIRRQGQREEWKEGSVRDRASEGHYLTGELVLLAKPPLPSVTPLRSVQQWNKKVAVKHQGNKMDRMGGWEGKTGCNKDAQYII